MKVAFSGLREIFDEAMGSTGRFRVWLAIFYLKSFKTLRIQQPGNRYVVVLSYALPNYDLSMQICCVYYVCNLNLRTDLLNFLLFQF